jgi:hypothetical protein
MVFTNGTTNIYTGTQHFQLHHDISNGKLQIIAGIRPHPYIVNLQPTNTTPTNAYMNGDLISTGKAETTVWLFWDTSDDGTNRTWEYTNEFGAQDSIGVMTTNVTGLETLTQYYYRYYASNIFGECWGEPTMVFTTPAVPPVVSNATPTNITETTAYMNGELISTGSGSVVVWLFWGETDGETNKSSWANTNYLGSKGPSAVLTTNISDLGEATQYFYAYYASNSGGGEAWAIPSSNFTTVAGSLSVGNARGATNITSGNAWMSGEMISTGSSATTVYIHWGNNDGGTNKGLWDTFEKLTDVPVGVFSAQANGLSAETLYYYRCSASNGGAEAWAPFTMAWLVRPIVTGRWELVSSPVHWGDGVSNQLDAVLGEQIATGVYSGATRFVADNLWVQDNSANWGQYYWHTTPVWKDAGNTNADRAIEPGRGFWIKRLTSGATKDIVFSGRPHTNSITITFATDEWQTFAWPYEPRHESAGWGFTNGTGSYSWHYGDNMLGEYNGQEFLIYLGTNDRWYVRSTHTLADITLEPGKAYWYRHRGGGMDWTAPKP